MKSMEEMIQAAQAAAETIQKQMNEAQTKLDQLEVEGTSGGGLVKIRCSAKGRVIAVAVDDSLMSDKGMLEDLEGVAHRRRAELLRPRGARVRGHGRAGRVGDAAVEQ